MFRKSTIWISIGVVVILQTTHAGWMRTYGGYSSDGAWNIQHTTDGGYIVVGWTDSFAESECDLWLLKTDIHGDTLWTKVYGGQGLEFAFCADQTSDGGYVVAGGTTSFGAGEEDIWLLKTDENGDTLWTKTYGAENFDFAKAVQQTSDSGYIITGYKDAIEDDGYIGYGDLWVLKTDKYGDTSWTFEYERSGNEGMWVEETDDECYIVANHGSPDLFKINAQGDTLWTQNYDGGVFNVTQTSDRGYIATGAYHGYLSLIKTDEYGEPTWTKYYDKRDNDGGVFVQETSDGGYIIVGHWGLSCSGGICTQPATWLLKTDSQGDTLWTRAYGELGVGDYGECVCEAHDGGYIIAGITSSYGAGGQDIWLIKTDSLGYVGIEEEPSATPVTYNWQVITSVGQQVVLQYSDMPIGFHASVFDASGRKVDELHSAGSSGTITWGQGYTSGVYFIRSTSGFSGATRRVILLK